MNPTEIQVLIFFGVLIWINMFVARKVKRKDSQYNDTDTEIIQELHRGLEKMASRIESLETILLDQGEHYRQTPPPVPDHENEEVR